MAAYTKEQIEKVIDMWDNHTRQEVADATGLNFTQLTYVTWFIRKCGHPLTRKSYHGGGGQSSAIREVLRERGLIK